MFKYVFTHVFSLRILLLAIEKGLDGGGGGLVLKILPIIHRIKILVYSLNKTNYSLTVRKVAKKSDYSLFIIFFFNSLKNRIIH